jgi:CxxC motif-containing protein (DUF1111 family)
MKITKSTFVYILFGITTYISFAYACRKAKPFNIYELNEEYSAGSCTTFENGGAAFGQSIEGLGEWDAHVHEQGDLFFGAPFLPANSNNGANGLGPLYNQTSCNRCHLNEGRGEPPLGGTTYNSMFFKMSMPGVDIHGAPLPVPGFGIQLQDRSLVGVGTEGTVETQWNYKTVILADGTSIELRYPKYIFSGYTPIPAGFEFSPRVSRPNFGMGLIESISEESILANADPDDINGDGISGKANYVYDYVTKRTHVLGRLGWKASVASIKNQVARALNEDIGITNSVFPNENGAGQPQLSNHTSLGYDLPDSILNALTFYMKTLAVPARRNVNDADVLIGKNIFASLGCVNCHVKNFKTGTNVSMPLLSNQYIRPYSDFLLHYMGIDLNDGRAEFLAEGNEWRTPPLWGIGLTQTVSGHTYFLHDGRARNMMEAILWHGGEALQAKEAYMKLSKTDRLALQRFLDSL